MPRRLVVFIDHHGLVRLNAFGHQPAWRRWAVFMARAGSLEGCLITWALLSLFDHRLAWPLISAGVIGLLVFKAIKHVLRRPRPFVRHSQYITAHSSPPDVFSFPSGHALHSATLGIIIALAWPWGWVVGLTWYVLMSVSRVVLGLHYPSDVVLGGVLGALIGWGCWTWL